MSIATIWSIVYKVKGSNNNHQLPVIPVFTSGHKKLAFLSLGDVLMPVGLPCWTISPMRTRNLLVLKEK